ncbi:hypothetical protein [Sanguibacter antarcticus]|uniref:FtsX-like permease family protein n=1 Tax=Sanguibacter antarcticus TaxID=372484 RepID=A0A2A9E172_9MICO|nr:hypothetical protein [Sanguibacter antarcticus]PFG32376.1 hypothetical protein ATL42_0201 [Sanguibacter antarcticus]
MVAASQTTARSVAVVESTVGANWRGAYDLLVGGEGVLSSAALETGGLVEENFASLGGSGGISADQLEAIGDLAGVEIAAPLAFVGQLETPSYGLLVGAMEADGAVSDFFSDTRAIEARVKVTVPDGVQTHTLSDSTTVLVTGQIDGTPRVGTDGNVRSASAPYDGTGTWGVDVTLPGAPALTSGLIAIDPVAERALLGDSGQFLDTLVEFDEQQSLGAEQTTLADLVDPVTHDYEYWALTNGYQGGPVVPVVVSNAAYPSLQGEVTFTPLDMSGTSITDLVSSDSLMITADGAALVDQAERGAPTTSTVDLTAGLTPFGLPALALALPGATGAPGGAATESAPNLTPALPGAAVRTAPSAQQASTAPEETTTLLTATPQGFTRMKVSVQEQTSTTEPRAQEQAYRQEAKSAADPEGVPLYVPVGTYTPGDITGTADSASYVPLGTYSAADVRVVEPGEHDGAVLAPSFSGRGAVLPAPGAITTLGAYAAMRGSGDADVVRVRVADVQGYSPQALDAIGVVAAQISDLGLDVRVVAGSSLDEVGVYLPEYFADGDLGWTTQEWTSLGAAVRVERAQIGATITLLVVALTGVSVLASVVQIAGTGRRRREAVLLSSLGWSRGRIRRWFLTEDVPSLALVVLAGLVAAAMSTTAVARGTSGAAALVYAAVAVAGTYAAARTSTRSPRAATGPARAARTARQVGRRVARAHPASGALSATAVIVLTCGAIAFASVIATAHVAAGTTRIATLVSASVLLPQTILAVGTLLAGAAMFVAGIRAGLLGAGAHHAMLVTTGWTKTALSASVRAQVIASLLPGIVLAVTIGVLLTTRLSSDLWAPLLTLTLSVPTAAALAAAAWAHRYAHTLSTTGAHR